MSSRPNREALLGRSFCKLLLASSVRHLFLSGRTSHRTQFERNAGGRMLLNSREDSVRVRIVTASFEFFSLAGEIPRLAYPDESVSA